MQWSYTTNPIEALQIVATQQIDLVFLDIHMPELSGIDFIKAINGKSKVILTTAYSEFALEGYELDVVDYLLKPIRLPAFLGAVQKAAKALKEKEVEDIEDDYIFVKTESKGKLLKINLADIDYIEGMKNYVAIHSGGSKIMVYTAMKEIEDRLPAKAFHAHPQIFHHPHRSHHRHRRQPGSAEEHQFRYHDRREL